MISTNRKSNKINDFFLSPEGQKLYPHRGHYSEGNFADLPEARNFREIKVRGKTKTDNQITLTINIHNTKKIEKTHILIHTKKSTKTHNKTRKNTDQHQ